MKNKPIKIRAVWTINPKSRIKEDKKQSNNPCDNCRAYLYNEEACLDCSAGINGIEEIGNA